MTSDQPSTTPWTVVRVDTEPMTDQHYDQAVTTFANLIALWRRNQENTGEDQEKSA